MILQQTLTVQSLQDYRLGSCFRDCFPDMPDPMFTRVMRYGTPVGSLIEVHDRIPRCMGRLRELIVASAGDREPLASGAVVMAHELVNSCGRFDRTWFAPRGGLWLAIAWADTLLPEYARLLPLAAGSACCSAIRSYGIDAAIKWVNDIHVGGRKIAGILCETFSGGIGSDRYHLIGIGINCNNIDFPVQLTGSAVSMQEMSGSPVSLEQFALVLLSYLTYHFGLVHLHEEQELEHNQALAEDKPENPVVQAWRKLSDSKGKAVWYGYDVIRQPLYKATVEDIDRTGGLVLRLANGQRITEHSGEILYLPVADAS